MRVWVAAVSLIWLTASAMAQSGSIQGTVFGPDGKSVDGRRSRPAILRQERTLRTFSAASGSYSPDPGSAWQLYLVGHDARIRLPAVRAARCRGIGRGCDAFRRPPR